MMRHLISAAILSLISTVLFALLCAIVPAISAFEPLGRALDEISVTDIYYSSIAGRRAVDNDKFLIIDTSPCTRSEIADAISAATRAGAAAVGIDIIFSRIDTDSAGTARLKQSVAEGAAVSIAAVHLNEWDEAAGRYVSTVGTALDSVDVRKAYTNLINGSDNSYIRNYSVADKGRVPSFAQAIACEYLAQYGEEADPAATDEGIIDFAPQAFATVAASDTAAIDSLAPGRIVLLGALHGDEDRHFTPVGPMSGLLIQAYSIDTLLGRPTAIAPGWLVWIIGIITVFLASWGFMVLRENFEARHHSAGRLTYGLLGLGNLIYPTLTILFTVFIIGEVYVLSRCYIPPLVIVGSLAFVPVAYDICAIVAGLTQRER